ncbi:acyl-CoA dehydrogenase family protein [Archaeoglobus neptunius]|uniref:acyl-CoA dehydrogenase family protein n=1 Tax=Archaeoglobus neptunius TaxID=2798580 RepID=UPI0019273656|nr:acyl-CoA dehydrogenase family protein [Archaeoglobus neptunius]
MAKFLDLDELSEEDRMLREEVHRFAEEVIRPASLELDRMPPDERIKPDSPYFKVMKQMKKLGYHRSYLPEGKGGLGLTPLQRYIIFEELAWGSLGFATGLGVDMIPFVCAALYGTPEIYEDLVRPWIEDEDGKFHGCWGVTEPEHGSDYLISLREDPELTIKFGKGNVVAEKDGDEWVITGQKSAWVSSAPVATHCGLHAQVKGSKMLGDGLFCIVPLDAEGVRKGKPVDMLGMRDDPQGELFFDNVRIPEHYVVVAPGFFYGIFYDQLLCLTSCGMGAFAVGLARACFEEALNYARQRVQGGVPIIKHKNVKLKLYEMFEKVETARYYVRKVTEYTHRRIIDHQTADASPRHARAAQIYAKKIAYEVAHDAVQIFGAYGLNKEFIIEKLFRDARSMLIEDGTVEVLSLEAAEDVAENYEKEFYDVGHITRLFDMG